MPLNYHGLADFRVDSVEVLDRLLTQSVTALIAEGLISLAAIAVDGTKVRASASKESFRTGENCSRSKRLSPSVWLRLSRSFRATRGVEPPPPSRARAGGARGSGAGGRSAGGARTASGERKSRAKKHARTRPGRSSRGLRRPTPRRAPCAFPTARFAPPTTPRSPRPRKRVSSSRSR